MLVVASEGMETAIPRVSSSVMVRVAVDSGPTDTLGGRVPKPRVMVSFASSYSSSMMARM